MYSADRRSQPTAHYAPNQHAPEHIATAPTQRQRALLLPMIRKALSWISEIRIIMPLSGLEPGPWRDNRPDWYYHY